MRNPQGAPQLRKLIALNVEHPYVKRRQVAESLCLWIKRLVSCSPLQELRLEVVDNITVGPNVSLDSLLHHLASRHRRTLRALRMGRSSFRLRTLESLCDCSNLEELELVITDHALVRESISSVVYS